MSKLCILLVQMFFSGEEPIPLEMQMNTQSCPKPEPTICVYEGKRTIGAYETNTFIVTCYNKKGEMTFSGEASYPMDDV